MLRMTILGLLTSILSLNALATELTITYSEDFQEQLDDTYGEKEGVYLSNKLRKYTEQAFDGNIPETVESINITIIKAKPNRPTFEQLSDRPGLSLRSFSIGGMSVEASIMLRERPEPIQLDYQWFETDIRLAKGKATWSDASKAARRFARKLEATVTKT